MAEEVLEKCVQKERVVLCLFFGVCEDSPESWNNKLHH